MKIRTRFTGIALAGALGLGTLVAVTPAAEATAAPVAITTGIRVNASTFDMLADGLRKQAYTIRTTTSSTTRQTAITKARAYLQQASAYMTGTSSTQWAKSVYSFNSSIAAKQWSAAATRLEKNAKYLSATAAAYRRGERIGEFYA